MNRDAVTSGSFSSAEVDILLQNNVLTVATPSVAPPGPVGLHGASLDTTS
jgi:hypothetical protein